MGRRNGERFLDRRRKGPKEKADATAEAVSFTARHLPRQPPLASHWHKGLRPASLDSFCLESRHAKAKGGYQLFKWPLLFPACPVAKFIKADKGIWLNHSFVMPYLEHSQSENQASWSMVLSMYSTPLLTRSLASHQPDH